MYPQLKQGACSYRRCPCRIQPRHVLVSAHPDFHRDATWHRLTKRTRVASCNGAPTGEKATSFAQSRPHGLHAPATSRPATSGQRTDKPVSGGSQPPVIPRSVAFGCTVHHTNYTRPDGQAAPCAAAPFLPLANAGGLLDRYRLE